MSPDPGNAGADLANPQSWNMYSYTFDNPMSFVDPTGMTTCDQNGDNCFDPSVPPIKVDVWCCSTEIGPVGGGSGAGGAPVPQRLVASKPQAPGRTTAVNQCAAQNAASLASIFHANPNNFWANALLGNDASTLSNLVFGPGRARAARSLAVSNPTKYSLINAGAYAAGQIPTGGQVYVSAGYDVLTQYGEAIEMQPVSKTLGMVAGEAVGKLAAFATGIKAVFDGGAYIYAEVGCAVK